MQILPAFVVFSRIGLDPHPSILASAFLGILSGGVNSPQDFSVPVLDVLAKAGHSEFAFQPPQSIPSCCHSHFLSSRRNLAPLAVKFQHRGNPEPSLQPLGTSRGQFQPGIPAGFSSCKENCSPGEKND